MSLLHNKLRPKKLDDYVINKEFALKIKNYVNSGEFLNIVISGVNGCGKYTLAQTILNEYYGEQIYNKKTNTFKLKIGTNIKSLDILQSNYHFEIFINQYLFNDKTTLLLIIKNIIKSFNVKTNSFNVIIIKSLDFLNETIISSFKSLMQEYIDTCRFIFICNSNSKINLIRSFVLVIKIPTPKNDEIIEYLKTQKINIKNKMKLIKSVNGNLNKLYCLLYNNTDKLIIDEYLEKFITLLNTNNIKSITNLKEHMYNYICKNFNKQLIYLYIVDYYLKKENISNEIKSKIIEISCKFQHRQINSYREIIHLEAYLVNIFNILHF